MSQVSLESASQFIDAIGVNIHLDQEGGYTAAAISADMSYLGLDAARNAAPGPLAGKQTLTDYAALAADGLSFDVITGGPIAATIANLNALVTAHPGSIAAIEGPNEINNYPFSYNGLAGTAAAASYQQALRQAVRADPLLSSVPVLNFTGSPYTPAAADGANAHVYPLAGAQPAESLATAYGKLQAVQPGLPVYFTEAGYSSLPGRFGWEGVDATTQAKLTLNLVMDAARLGVASTYLYDLIDDGPDPAGDVLADHFGLFTASGVAKPAAVALHNLTMILADPGVAGTSFSPTPLNYSITGLPANAYSLLVEKSSGVYDLIVWAEPTIWSTQTASAVAAAPTSVTIDLGAAFAQVETFDPLAASTPLTTAANTETVSIALTDHPIIIRAAALVTAMASFAPSAATAGSAGLPATSTPAHPASPIAAPH
jgi:hypothetical protein